jgi:hypothetical protein
MEEGAMRTAFIIWLAVAAVSFGQESATVSLSNGVQLRISAQSSTGSVDGLKTEMQPASGNSFYRIYRDESGLAVFAYQLEVERTSDGSQFRVTASPAGSEFAARFPNADGGKPTPTISEPRESPLLDSGGRFSIEIPTNPGLQLTLTDIVQVQLNRRGPPANAEAASSAQIRFAALQVRLDGKLASSGGAGAIVAGRYAMFYVPGRGGYFFSAEPVEQPPFLHVGVVDKTKLSFTVDNDTYECESDSQIMLKSERGQIWVFHDPNYKPDGNWTKSDTSDGSRDQFFTAAADSLSWWLP